MARGTCGQRCSDPAVQVVMEALCCRSLQSAAEVVPQRPTQHCGGLYVWRLTHIHEAPGDSIRLGGGDWGIAETCGGNQSGGREGLGAAAPTNQGDRTHSVSSPQAAPEIQELEICRLLLAFF